MTCAAGNRAGRRPPRPGDRIPLTLADPDVRLIVTADHGLVDVDRSLSSHIADSDPLFALLDGLPSGERRFLIFRTRPGCEEKFEAEFRERFGDSHHLFSAADVAASGILGPLVTPLARSRPSGRYRRKEPQKRSSVLPGSGRRPHSSTARSL